MRFKDMTLAALLALSPACGGSPSSGGSSGGSSSVADKVSNKSTTNADGDAFFDNVDPITVVDGNGNPLANVSVSAYDMLSGDVYLTPGGIAAFPDVEQSNNTLTQYLQQRTLVVHPNEGLTLFDNDSEEVVFDLMRWVAGQEYNCDGVYTTEQLIEGREQTAQLISYFDPTGKVKKVYDGVEWLIDNGFVDDLPAGKKWFVLSPVNPTAPPMTVQRGLAQGLFDEGTYDSLNRLCEDMTGEGGECDDGDPCTYDDALVGGSCIGTSYNCEQMNDERRTFHCDPVGGPNGEAACVRTDK